jgi:hypothetical protein
LSGVPVEAEEVAIEDDGAAQPDGPALGVAGHGYQDVKEVVARSGGGPPRSAPQVPVELAVDSVEEAGVVRMVGLELFALTHPVLGVVEFRIDVRTVANRLAGC